MSDIVSIDPLNLVAPLIVAALGMGWEFVIRPKLHLKENIDHARGTDDYYLRLRVRNTGRRTAKDCVGRMVEIRRDDGRKFWNGQLNFCWTMHNQLLPPKPIEIPRKPFETHLDLARYTTDDPAHLRLRVDTYDQAVTLGKSEDFYQQAIPVGTYFVLVTIHTAHWFVRPKKWYVLRWDGTEYVIKRYKRWRHLWRWKS